MSELRSRHPQANFKPFMRQYIVDVQSGKVLPKEQTELQAGDKASQGQKLQYLPRIRCTDCQGKIYTAQPESVVTDFEVHLKNKKHLEKVEERLREEGSSGRGASRKSAGR